MNLRILPVSEYSTYIEHVRDNLKNSRVDDPDLLQKITRGLEDDPRIIIFVCEENNRIVSSVLTVKRVRMFEYCISNYRTSKDTFFNKKHFYDLLNFVLTYYENIGYYRWILARPLDLLNTKFFKDIGVRPPFDRYVTAIESSSNMYDPSKTHYNDILFGIPDGKSVSDYMVIAGFCKQEFRTITHVDMHKFL